MLCSLHDIWRRKRSEILDEKMVFVGFSYLLYSLDIMKNITKGQRTVVKSTENIKYKTHNRSDLIS